METPGVINSKASLWLRKITVPRELVADRSLTVSHQAQTATEHLRVKQKQAWTKEETKVVMWCYMYCRQHFAGNYKKMYEIWRQRNPDSILDAKKLLNQKNIL